MGHSVVPFLIFGETSTLISIMTGLVLHPPRVCQDSSFPTSLPEFSVRDLDGWLSVWPISSSLLGHVFLVARNVEYISKRLLAICLPSFENHLFISLAHLLSGSLDVLLFNFCPSVSILILFTMAWNWNRLVCPPTEEQIIKCDILHRQILFNYKESDFFIFY